MMSIFCRNTIHLPSCILIQVCALMHVPSLCLSDVSYIGATQVEKMISTDISLVITGMMGL